MYGSGANQGIGNMDYCKVLWGGSSYAAVQFNQSDDGYFTNSLIQNSNSSGLYTYYDTIAATNNSFLDCNDYGVYTQYSEVNLDNCIINNNGSHGIYNYQHGELQINNCQFNNNGGYAAYLQQLDIIQQFTGNTGSGNTINAFGIGGAINQNYTLGESVCGFPFVLIGTVTLNQNFTMDIPAGEVIKAYNGGLNIYGTLNAIGTSSQNIVFTSLYDDTYGGDLNGDGNATTPAKGNWTYIQMLGSGANQGIGNMDYCKVLWGGSSYAAVLFNESDDGYYTNSVIQNSNNDGLYLYYDTITATNNSFLDCNDYGVYSRSSVVNLDNCIINNNGSHGIYNESSGELQINNCQFNNNGEYAAYLQQLDIIQQFTGNTGSGNTINAFGIGGAINQNYTLSESVCGFPFVLIGTVTLNQNFTMDIPAGEVIKAYNGGLNIYGTLNAIGTSSQNIVFTSLFDDTYGGDLNGDGNATTPAKGNWTYIQMYGSGAYQGIGNMDYCKVLWGGSSYAAVLFNESDDGYYTNSVIQNSNNDGLYLYYDTITATNNSFLDCNDYGVYSQYICCKP